jgi:carboxypeptidase C (cathepsin A)
MRPRNILFSLATSFCLIAIHPLHAKESDADSKHDATEEKHSPRYLKDESEVTAGSITVRGAKFPYHSEAGIQVVYLKDPKDDDPLPHDEHGAPPTIVLHASMSYVAYFKGDHEDPRRPITFLFNGGPGSSTVWLHMGAFGPKRVLTANDSHSPAAPYRLVDNEYSLLDASDLVFIDAPGTGFGHVRGPDKEKAFFGVDQDAHAFANFIVGFLTRHGRWN